MVLPAGKVARGKLAQAVAAGARLVMVDGNFDEALAAVRQLGEEGAAAVVNSINPDRIAGQQTVAFEIVDALGESPEAVALPVGNAGNITAAWAGFVAMPTRAHAIRRRPRMLGFQAAGAAPIVNGAPVEEPETVATAIRIGNPASWSGAEAARDESGGVIEAVSDDEIVAMQHRIARAGGDLLRARLGGRRGGRARAWPAKAGSMRPRGRLHPHRPRPQGPGRGRAGGGQPAAGRLGPGLGPAGDG